MYTLWWAKPKPVTLQVSSNWQEHGNATQAYQVIVYGGAWDEREKRLKEMFAWCNEHYGKHTSKWKNPRWSSNKNKSYFYFRDERDCALFVMRWS